MTVAILVISALSLVVQLAIGASLLYVARGFLKSVEAPLPQTQSAQPTQLQKPHIRLVEGDEN